MCHRNRPLLIHLIAALTILTGWMTAEAQTRRPAAAAPTEETYAGIEVGAKGIKSLIVRVSNDDEGYNVRILSAEVVNTTLVQTRDGKFTLEAIKDTGVVVQRFYQRIRNEYKVPSEQIFIVGSSGLIGDNPQDIVDEVKRLTGQAMTFLDLDTEVQLSISGTIPRRYRSGGIWYENRNISVLVDIGSGNTKGGYQQLRQVAIGRPDYDYVTWGIPKGTVTFSNDVNKVAGEAADYRAFTAAAQNLANTSLRSLIRPEISRKPALLNRRKVYLSGGVIWAMTTLLHPEDRRSYVPVNMADISNFSARLLSDPEGLLNPDLSGIRNPSLREEAEREVENVRNTFTPKNLIAGSEILKAVATEMNFANKRMLFARFGHLSWILSYVRLQAE